MASMMPCPACGDAMIVLEFQDVETDYCPKCGGIWLDHGELGLILKHSLDLPPTPVKSSEPGRRRCPHCTRRMRVTRLPGAGVEVDLCPRDHGIWLDKGELQAIIAAGADRANAAALAKYCESVFGKV
jgi:uncharacterized protein